MEVSVDKPLMAWVSWVFLVLQFPVEKNNLLKSVTFFVFRIFIVESIITFTLLIGEVRKHRLPGGRSVNLSP